MKLSIAAAIMAFTSTSVLAAPSPGPDPMELVLSVDEVDFMVAGVNPAGNTPKPKPPVVGSVGILLIGRDPSFGVQLLNRNDSSVKSLYEGGAKGAPVSFITIVGVANCIFLDEKGVKQAQVVSTKSGASTTLCSPTPLKDVTCHGIITS